MRRFMLAIAILAAFVSSAAAQQPYYAPQQPLFQVQWVVRPAWPFGCRYVVRPMIVPVYPQAPMAPQQ
jgi:hypothetical protein